MPDEQGNFVTLYRLPSMRKEQLANLERRCLHAQGIDLSGVELWNYQHLFNALGMHVDHPPFVTTADANALFGETPGGPGPGEAEYDMFRQLITLHDPDIEGGWSWRPLWQEDFDISTANYRFEIAMTSWRLSIQWRLALGLCVAQCLTFHQHGGRNG